MGKNDFDIDFDFEKEYGFDPKEVLGDEEYDDNMDFSDEDLGLTSQSDALTDEDGEDTFDMGSDLDLNEFLNLSGEADVPYFRAEETYEAEEPEEEEVDVPNFFEEDREPLYEEDDDQADIPAYDYTQEQEEPEQPVFTDEPVEDDDEDDDDDDPDPDNDEDPTPKPTPKPFKLPKINMPKFKTPKFLISFYDLYFAPVLNKSLREEPQDPNNPRRRRRKSKQQIFKEVYLPPIIVCVSLILVLSFAIGALSNLIEQKRIDDATQQSSMQESQNAEALAEQRYQQVMQDAEELAAGYNYKRAIEVLDSFGDMTQYPDMQTKRAEYVNIQNSLVEHKDISTIPNLSFHVLVHDLSRALADNELGGSYNRNFISTAEFQKILEQLYANGYVLVDFDNVTGSNVDATGAEMFFPNSIYLPADKKPIMLTETMVNYFAYMIDGNSDGVADAQGDGFASKLVVQNGTIEAEYVDANGQTLVGDYDFVPILEAFIEAHPDFSYQGARATLAVCGYEGVFGYRTNTSYIATKGNDYYNNEVNGAKEVAAKLREMGYTIACYTYGNEDYSGWTANQISADMQLWTQQITPVLGDVNTIVFARAKDIQAYNGNAFDVLYTSGFRYFVANATQPWAEINTNYVRQKRLMVTGNSMQWYPNQFNGMFDCAAILDVNTRGSVPN